MESVDRCIGTYCLIKPYIYSGNKKLLSIVILLAAILDTSVIPLGSALLVHLNTSMLKCICDGREGVWEGGRDKGGERGWDGETCATESILMAVFLTLTHYYHNK